MSNQHQIRRVKVHCKCMGRTDSPADAIHLANKTAEALNKFCREKLPALLEMAFQKNSLTTKGYAEGYTISIDALEINLGKLRLSQLEEVLTQKLEDSFNHAQNATEAMCFQKWFFGIISAYLISGVSPWNSNNLSIETWNNGLSLLCGDINFHSFLNELALKQGDIVMQRMASLLDGLGIKTTLNKGKLNIPASFLPAENPHNLQIGLIDNEQIAVKNAGIVLLSPFLPFFFKRLNLVDESHCFLSTEHCIQGIKILQKLAYPEESVIVEGDLCLNKLLCGWPVCEPLILKDNTLVHEHKNKHKAKHRKEYKQEYTKDEEFSKLLDVIKEQWGAIQGYSHEKLTQTFFQRSGIIQMHGKKSLNVEWCPQDVLLNRLPWVLSIIQTPWMNEALKVVWSR